MQELLFHPFFLHWDQKWTAEIKLLGGGGLRIFSSLLNIVGQISMLKTHINKHSDLYIKWMKFEARNNEEAGSAGESDIDLYDGMVH